MAAEIVPGMLLVASVDTSDGVFDQSVVLVIDSDATGAVGVILNKYSTVDVERALPAWAPLLCQPPVLFDGGPVSQGGAICLAAPLMTEEEPPGWRPVYDGVGLLNLDTPVEIARGAYTGMRVFAGYSGWAPGQLAAELGFGLWHVVPGTPHDPFDPDPLTLWRRVLRRQGGDLALLSTWTPDAALN